MNVRLPNQTVASASVVVAAPSSTTPSRNREITCNSILDATRQLIAEKGVDGFTISEVAERGNVNRSLIYHYYEDRSNLLFETVRFVVTKYEQLDGTGTDNEFERSIQPATEDPEIGRFFFQIMLAGKPLPNLNRRIVNGIKELERQKAANLTIPTLDPTLAVISGWLLKLAWSCGRQEMARLLGLSVEEADRRFIANMRNTSLSIRRTRTAD